MSKHILILAGDGIGPEIVGAAEKVLTKVNDKFNLGLTWDVIIKSGPSSYPDNAFSVSQFTPNLGIPIVSCLALTPNGTYTIELNVQDEGGLSTSTFAEAQRLTRVVTVTGPEVG